MFGNPGYDGQSRSINSEAAIEEYRVPMSMITKKTIIDFENSDDNDDVNNNNKPYPEKVFGLPVYVWKNIARQIGPSEWHHTGKFYRETYHYDLNKVADYLKAHFDQIKENYASYKKSSSIIKKSKDNKPKSVKLALLKVTCWSGSRNYPKITHEHVCGYVMGNWLICYKGSQYKYNINANRVDSEIDFSNVQDFCSYCKLSCKDIASFLKSENVRVDLKPSKLVLAKYNRREREIDKKYPSILKFKKLIKVDNYKKAVRVYVFSKLKQCLKYRLSEKFGDLIPQRVHINKDLVGIIRNLYGMSYSLPYEFYNWASINCNKTYKQYLPSKFNKIANYLENSFNNFKDDYISSNEFSQAKVSSIYQIKTDLDNIFKYIRYYVEILKQFTNINTHSLLKALNNYPYCIIKEFFDADSHIPLKHISTFSRKSVLSRIGHGLYPLSIFDWNGSTDSLRQLLLKWGIFYSDDGQIRISHKYNNKDNYEVYSVDLNQFVYTPMFFDLLNEILKSHGI